MQEGVEGLLHEQGPPAWQMDFRNFDLETSYYHPLIGPLRACDVLIGWA
jgi:hypothetical protein